MGFEGFSSKAHFDNAKFSMLPLFTHSHEMITYILAFTAINITNIRATLGKRVC